MVKTAAEAAGNRSLPLLGRQPARERAPDGGYKDNPRFVELDPVFQSSYAYHPQYDITTDDQRFVMLREVT